MTETIDSLRELAEAARQRKMDSFNAQRYEDAAKHRNEERRLLALIEAQVAPKNELT